MINVSEWMERARRDDVFNTMVPSDLRKLVGEIERLTRERDDLFAENGKIANTLAAENARLTRENDRLRAALRGLSNAGPYDLNDCASDVWTLAYAALRNEQATPTLDEIADYHDHIANRGPR